MDDVIGCEVIEDDGSECGTTAVQFLRFTAERGAVALCERHRYADMPSELTPEEYRAANR